MHFLDAFVRCSTRKEMAMSTVSIDALTDPQIPPWESDPREEVRAEGWGWVACERGRLALDLRRYGTEPMTRREPTADELRLLARLDTERERLISAYDANEAERDPRSEAYCSQEQYLCSAIDDVRDRMEAAEGSLLEWTPEQTARLGAVVCVGACGDVRVHRGVFRRGERPAIGGTPRREAGDPRLARDLSAHRTAALQAMVMQSTQGALAILAHRMLETLFERHGPGNDVVKVHIRATTDDALSADATDYENSPAGWLLASAHAEWSACLPTTSEALFHWLLDLDQEALLQLLAYCTARCITVVSEGERDSDLSDVIARAFNLDMADWWLPNADNYLRHVSRRDAVAAVREATGEDCTQTVSGMPREEAARFCAAKLGGTRWLPEALRPLSAPEEAAPAGSAA
jgi:ParB family chromosome partitioning protein